MALRYATVLLITALVTAGLAAGAVARLPMQVFEESYAMYRDVKETSLTNGQGARVLIIGDSRAKAGIDPERLDSNALSLTLPGGSAIELYYTLQRYLEHHTAPEHAVLSFSAVHFEGSLIFWERTVKFDYLEEPQYADILRTAERLHDDTFGTPIEAHLTYLLEHHNAPHMYLPELRSALFHPRGATNEKLFSELRSHRGHCLFGQAPRSDGLSYETSHPKFEPSPTFDDYFRRLLDRLRKTGARVVYQAMPLNRQSVQHLTPAFVEAYQRYFQRIARDYPDMTFSADWPIFPDEHFGDPNHLNQRGAEEMTRRVKVALQL